MADLAKDLPDVPLPVSPPMGSEDPPKRPGLVKRLTTKLRAPPQPSANGSPPLDGAPEDAHAKHKRKISLRMPTLPSTSTVTRSTNHENAFTSPEQREAALRACGLIPAHPRPGRDTHGYMLPLSEQEERLDRDWAIVPGDAARVSPQGESEAERIKEAWMKKNLEPAAAAPSLAPPPRSQSLSPNPRPTKTPSSSSPTPSSTPSSKQSPARGPSPDRVRPEFQRDPNVARLMQAMQGYKPENYRPTTQKRAPTGRLSVDSDSDTDSD